METVYFKDVQQKKENRLETFRIVEEKLKEVDIKKIVLASTTGDTARIAMDYFRDKGVQLIVVPHQYDFTSKGNRFPLELANELRENGHEVHFGTMLFHTDKLFGSTTPLVVANFLRCFCEGIKVCFEITMMVCDGGLISSGEKVIAIAGTGLGADTAVVMQAASSRNVDKLRVNEILCKPLNELVQE